MSGLLSHFIFGHPVNRRSAFTLVEMLAVMGIIVILLFTTLPAFRGFNQSESRRGAVGAVMGSLDRARMMAISDGLATYVVFASKTTSGAQINPALWGRSYAIFQDSDNVNFNIVQRTPWMNLPANVAFKVSADVAPSILTCYLSDAPQLTDPTFPVSGSAISPGTTGSFSASLPYWKFDGTGSVVVPGRTAQNQLDNLKVLLFPGYVDSNGIEVSTQNSAGSAGNKTATLLSEIDVNQATGRAKYNVDPLNNLTTPSPTPP